MGKNTYTPPTVKHVQSEGGVLQTIGLLVAAIGLLLAIAIALSGGTPVLFALVPIGLLTAITGYLKQIAAATSASYVLAMNAVPTKVETPVSQD
ncbi:hypothetical protein [Glutamicibacter arilaitensis]|uniref:hypothetical protein n=1 Tax=Glutamicibacter arilaitensis TaxID=256701 RepID=UPI00384F45BA